MDLDRFFQRSSNRRISPPLVPLIIGLMLTACAPITPPPSLPSPISVPSMPSSSSSPANMPSLPSPSTPSTSPSQPSSSTTSSETPPNRTEDSASAPGSQTPDFPRRDSGNDASISADPGVFDPLAGEASKNNESQEDQQELSWEKTKPSSSSEWETSNETPSESAQSSRSEASGENSEATQTALEGKLQSTLDDFDREIMNERQVLAANEAPASESQLKGEEAGPEPARTPSANESSTSIESGSGGFQVSAQPIPARRAGNPIPDDIPDARDDDIIARQLREAAMQEQDPVLKKKLWEEYKRYKRG